MLNRTIAPESKEVQDINFIRPVEKKLDNGIPVFIVNAGQQELVRIEFLFQNVNWDNRKSLQSLVVSHLINNGTESLSAKDIADRIDYYGSFLQTEYGADRCSVKLYSLNKHLADVLPIVYSILNDSTFSDRELAIFVQNQKQSLAVSLQKNDFLARKQFANKLFGDTPYGSNITPEDFDDIKRDDLLDYFKAAYKPENCTIIAAGKFEDKEYNILNSLIGREWANSSPSTVNSFRFSTTPGSEIVIEKPDALQSAIRMGVLTINRSHADFAGLQVLNCVLGGYFGSRLMSNIREDKGYTYGIGSRVVSLQDTGYLFIATEVGAEVCSRALDEIEKEIEVLKTTVIPDEELALVRSYMLGSLLGSLENAFSHADKFKNLYFSGMDYSYYDRYIQTVRTVSADELRKLAHVYLNIQDFTKVIAGRK